MDSGVPLSPKRQGSPFVTLAPASGALTVFSRRWVNCAAVLLDASAAALNQNNEYDDEENAGNDANQSGAIHLKTPFLGATL